MNPELLDRLFKKRYCLPIDANIESYEEGYNTVNKCLCSNFNHISCVLEGKKLQVLTLGINIINDNLKKPGIHAEQAALSKLVPLKNKNIKKINILVIKISKKNKLQSSKPCLKCIDIMKDLPKKGYYVKNIYYSDTNGNIIKKTLKQLDNEEKHVSQYYINKFKDI